MRNLARRSVSFAVLVFALAGAHRGGQAVGQAVVGNGYVPPLPIAAAPGQLLTIYVQDMGANLTAPAEAQSVPLPTSVAGISVKFEQTVGPSPIESPVVSAFPLVSCWNGPDWCAHFIGINLQVPYEMRVSGLTAGGVAPNYAKLTVAQNGASTATVALNPFTDQIHIVRYDDSLMGFAAAGGSSSPYAPPLAPVVTHADGAPVTAQNPAQPGETVVIYAVGVGFGLARMQDLQLPEPQTGAAPLSPMTGPGLAPIFDFRPNASPSESLLSRGGPFWGYSGPVAESWAVAGYPGLYQINLTIPMPPSTAAPCGAQASAVSVQSNLTINLAGFATFDGAPICVALPAQAATR